MFRMTGQAPSTQVVALLVTLVLAAGCGERPKDPEASGEMVIRSYSVPEGMDADELRMRLRSSLKTGDQEMGTVNAFPDGSLVVTAPASVQAGVEALIQQMKTAGPSTVPEPATVAIDYWIVVGRYSARANWPPVGDDGKLIDYYEDRRAERELSKIAPALDQISGAQGPMTFRLLEKQRLASVSTGEPSRIAGRLATVVQRVSNPGSGGSYADIQINLAKNSIATRVKLEPGRLIVLGEAGYGGDWAGSKGETDNPMLYYVISADID